MGVLDYSDAKLRPMTLKIERANPTPIYQQISAWMREQIQTGIWRENHRLKSEPELAEELGVNRGTLRKAINDLISEGLLVTIHGRGTFIASARLEQSLADRLVASSEDLVERGIAFDTTVLEQCITGADQRIASMLSIAPGEPVFVLKRVRYTNGKPFMVLTNYIPHKHVPGIEALDFTKLGLFTTLEVKFKRELAWGKRNFEARAASDDIASALEIAPCDAVMYLNQIVYSPDGKAEELSDVHFRGDSFCLTATVHRNGSRAAEVTSQEFVKNET